MEQIIQRFSGNSKTLDPDAQVLASLHHLAGGGGALQHRRPDLHCQCRLSRLLRQCGQHGCLPADHGRAGRGGHDRDGACAFVSNSLGANKREMPAVSATPSSFAWGAASC